MGSYIKYWQNKTLVKSNINCRKYTKNINLLTATEFNCKPFCRFLKLCGPFLFTNNFLFKQSTFWYIKIIKALHGYVRQLIMPWLSHLRIIYNSEWPLCINLQLEKCSTIYNSLLKELSLIELKVG